MSKVDLYKIQISVPLMSHLEYRANSGIKSGFSSAEVLEELKAICGKCNIKPPIQELKDIIFGIECQYDSTLKLS